MNTPLHSFPGRKAKPDKVDPLLEKIKAAQTTAAVPTPSISPSEPRTSIGRSLLREGIGLEARIAELAKRWDTAESDGSLILKLNPEIIRHGQQANRLPQSLDVTDKDFEDLKSSLKEYGQILPIAVRPISDSTYKYELVSGHRRHAAALLLNREVAGGFVIRAVLDSEAHDDATLAIHMYEENATRKDLSAYETGMMFARLISEGVFKSQADLARRIRKDRSTVRQYIDIAELPKDVLAAFRDPRSIAVYWNKELTSACRDRGPQTMARAAKLLKVNPPPSADEVYRFLTAPAPVKDVKPKAMKLQETVKINDKPLFNISMRGHKWTINSSQIPDDKCAVLYDRLKVCAHEFILAEMEVDK